MDLKTIDEKMGVLAQYSVSNNPGMWLDKSRDEVYIYAAGKPRLLDVDWEDLVDEGILQDSAMVYSLEMHVFEYEDVNTAILIDKDQVDFFERLESANGFMERWIGLGYKGRYFILPITFDDFDQKVLGA